jgi:cysteinyl-tRNA synthetase
MIAMILDLESKGYTYATADGIYFDTSKFPTYADFARLDVKNLQAGNRVVMGEKRNSTDFALWKFSPKDKKRQMEWTSPWGQGFPGWHIECSAMALTHLEQPIDIHCGGIDHVRVHHTNEIAQAEASTGKPFAKYWLHGEFLVMDKGKMAKSGEFVTLDSVKKAGIDPLAYRFFCYSAHYRNPLTFSWENLQAAASGFRNLKELIIKETHMRRFLVSGRCSGIRPLQGNSRPSALTEPFWEALRDDCNMPIAMSLVWDMLRNKGISPEDKFNAIKEFDWILRLNLFSIPKPNHIDVIRNGLMIHFIFSEEKGSPGTKGAGRAELIEAASTLLENRKMAREKKLFQEADDIRNQLKKWGLELKDLPGNVIECTIEGGR